MKYLITGINGFAAPHLAKILIENGHDVFGSHKSSEFCKDNLRDVMGDYVNKITILKCDLLDFNSIREIFLNNKFDGIFHLAAFTHPPTSFKIPDEAFKINALGTVILCEEMRKSNPDCIFMQCSTSEVYGVCTGLISENNPMNPMNPYAVSKAAGDLYILERTRNNMINGFFTRAFSHTGPRRMPNYSISSDAIQIARILKGKQDPIIKVGNLSAVRNVMDVRDVVDVYYKLMLKMQNKEMVNGEIFNISGNEAHEIGYYLNIMLEINKIKDVKIEKDPSLFRPIDIPVQYPDNTKVKKYLKWEPSIDIKKTLGDLVDYWIKYEQKINIS